MKVSGGETEKGIVVGNTYDKYGAKNVIVKKIMQGFEESLTSLVERVDPDTIYEVGCGEGYWVMRWHSLGISARGSDFSSRVIELARKNAAEALGDTAETANLFAVESVYDLDQENVSADLVVCCEVLEHLEDPEEALLTLKKIAKQYVIMSVPREPIWRLLNLARGKYITRLGNTPGHIQHWSKKQFIETVQAHFNIVEVKSPLPWTMLLCTPRD